MAISAPFCKPRSKVAAAKGVQFRNMNIRHLRYFVTLASEGHFGRASLRCHVTQPTLSEAVRQLERELSMALIDRKGQRYAGLTPGGRRVLSWAQRILADQKALEQELEEMRGILSGELNFGVIPAAMPVAPLVTRAFAARHPAVTLRLLSLSSIDIQRGLDEGTLEAGMTYLDNEPLRNIRSRVLYNEQYMLLTPAGGEFDGKRTVRWSDIASLPLCLLTRDMQNRRIIDRLLVEGGAAATRVAIETNSVLALIAQVRAGGWSSVVPHTFLTLLGHERSALTGLRAIPLVKPQATHSVGLVVNDREPQSPLTRAFLKTVAAREVQAELLRALPKFS
jgi:DNA-binding transcriptional LysR family regulator